jgi:SAM-dependent methyltransferase
VASHRDLIVDQFTRQAVPFSTAPGIRDEDALARLVAFAGARPDDVTPDVACGPGLVVCAFARVVRRAWGVDLTPAMIARVRELARADGPGDVGWQVGDALRLPFAAGTFSIVTSRFALHHCPEPAALLHEMARVCRPGGTVVLADVTAPDDPRKAEAFNRMETLRDPSHVRALALAELVALFPAAGLPRPRAAFYRLRSDVDGMLSRSFPHPGDAEVVRRMFVDALADDGLGLGAHRHGDGIRFAYPVAILGARLPG